MPLLSGSFDPQPQWLSVLIWTHTGDDTTPDIHETARRAARNNLGFPLCTAPSANKPGSSFPVSVPRQSNPRSVEVAVKNPSPAAN